MLTTSLKPVIKAGFFYLIKADCHFVGLPLNNETHFITFR